MPEIVIHDDESFERALRRFKKKCEKAGILSDLRKHRHYESRASAASANECGAAQEPAPALRLRCRARRAAAGRPERGAQIPRSSAYATVLDHPRRPQEPRIALHHPLSDDEGLEVVRRGIKQRREAAEQFAAVDRRERADAELAEVAALEVFLPAQVPPDEIRAAVRAVIAGGARDLGKVMGQVMPHFKGRADGKLINQIAREELSAAV
jgi:ribosomal protein S21